MNRQSHFTLTCLLLSSVGLIAMAHARSAEPLSQYPTNSIDSEQQGRSSGSGVSGSVFGDLRSVYQIYKDCAGPEVSSCLKLKLLTTMERVSRSAQLNIAEGVTLIKDESGQQQANEEQQQQQPIKSIQEIEANLPRSLEDKEEALNSMIVDKAVGFLQSHTLKLKLPNVEELQRSLSEEGNFFFFYF